MPDITLKDGNKKEEKADERHRLIMIDHVDDHRAKKRMAKEYMGKEGRSFLAKGSSDKKKDEGKASGSWTGEVKDVCKRRKCT